MTEVRVKASDFGRSKKKTKEKSEKSVNRRVKTVNRQPRPPSGPPVEDEEDEVEVEVPDGTDIHQWPTRAEAAKRIGVNKRTIMRWQKDGDLESVIDEKGFFRFNPEDIAELSAGRTGDAAQMMGQSVAMVVQTSSELTDRAQQHAQAFADKHLAQSDIAFRQMTLMNAQIIEENSSLRAYIRELETDRRAAVKEVEEAQTKVHQRRLDELKVTNADKRVDWALGALFNLAGPAILAKLNIVPAGPIPPPPGLDGSAINPAFRGAAEPPSGPAAQESIDDYLKRLETNCIVLIAGIDETRFKMLCQFSTPAEVSGMTEVREIVAKLRAKHAEGQS